MSDKGAMSIDDALSRLRRVGIGFGGTSSNEEVECYLNYYELPSMQEAKYLYGFIPFGGGRIWTMFISPLVQPNGTVAIVHGYQSHVGDQRNVAKKYLSEGNAVLLFDLPGHGLSLPESPSERKRQESHVDDFSHYVHALEAVLGRTKDHFIGQITFFGHSQAFSILAKYARGKKNVNIVTFAPMERLANYFFVRILALLPIKRIVGVKANVSSDVLYNSFAKGDPLQSKVLTIGWLRAAIRVHKEFVASKAYDASVRVTIIQGDKDGIVDWRYNMISIPTKMSMVQISIVEGADHQLQNESEELRKKIFA